MSRRLRFLLVLCMLSLLSVSVLPARAETSASQAYLAARERVRISSLTLRDARRSTGHHGKIVEWSGIVQGAGTCREGIFFFLRLRSGETLPVRLRASLTLGLGTPVYVLGRVVEKSSMIDHLDPVAIAPCSDVIAVHAAARKRYAARRRAAVVSAPARLAGADPRTAPFMKIDTQALESRAPGSLTLQGAVQWIRSFNRRMDARSADAIGRTVLYYCGSYRVNPRLALALLAAESAFRHDAVSSAGALGLGQLMPGTAAMLGVRNPLDPYQNVEGAVRHMSTLLSRWQGSPYQVPFALASYNAGAGAVMRYGGIPPYPETVSYVRTILAYYGELVEYR